MRLRFSLLLTVLLVISSAATAQQQDTQSDYEIQKEFKTQYRQLRERLAGVSSSDSAQAIIEDIKKLDNEYQEHAELLNEALYPDSYEQEMKELRESSVMALNRLQKTEKREKRLTKLEDQIQQYEQNLQTVNFRMDSLKQAMQKSIESEKRLSGMVRDYRKSLEQRDELILAFIDSMVTAYQKMDLQSIKDLENLDRKTKLETDGNALSMIREITAENLDILKKNSDKLRLQDYLRMSEVQREFQNMWDKLGSKIQSVYDDEDAEILANQINKNIAEWDQTLRNQTFSTLSDTLNQQGVSVNQFNSSEQLYSSINNYLDKQIKQSRDGATEEGYEQFQKFQNFWNKVELNWQSNLEDAGILSNDQLSTINAKVDTWAQNARPQSNILVYLLGASVLLAIVLGVMWIREKNSKNKS